MQVLSAKKIEHYAYLLMLTWSQVKDPRAYRGEKQEELAALLSLLVVSISVRRRKLRQAESLSVLLGKKIRKAIGLIKKQVSDTCLYECLERTHPDGCEHTVIEQIKQALHRKQITNDRFPAGVVSFDGKKTAHGEGTLPDGAVMKVHHGKTKEEAWRLHALRACLTSSRANPILGQYHLDNKCGESPAFRELFPQMVAAFPRLFQVVTVDAAFTNVANATLVRSYQKDYLFAVKGNQKHMFAAIQERFGDELPYYSEKEYVNGEHISRCIRREAVPPSVSFPGATQIIHVRQRRYHVSKDRFTCEDRYFISSIPYEQFQDKEMLQLIRLHWGIENGSNWTCDVIFDEDTHFPCNKGYGPMMMSWLQVIAYNVISIVRSLCLLKPKTPRGKKVTRIPFKELVELLFLSFVQVGVAGRGAETL